MVLDAAGLDDAARLANAVRADYSETAFAESAGSSGQHRIRYFSPKAEAAFCRHATIATAVATAERDGPRLPRFDTLAGPAAVRTSPSPAGLTATLTSVPTRTRPAQAAELDAAPTALRRRGEDLDPRHPARDPFRPGGVVEDPATGAAAAAFGGYLPALPPVHPPARVTILQGEDMGRPSRLLVDLAAGDERVQVTGTADPIPAG